MCNSENGLVKYFVVWYRVVSYELKSSNFSTSFVVLKLLKGSIIATFCCVTSCHKLERTPGCILFPVPFYRNGRKVNDILQQVMWSRVSSGLFCCTRISPLWNESADCTDVNVNRDLAGGQLARRNSAVFLAVNNLYPPASNINESCRQAISYLWL